MSAFLGKIHYWLYDKIKLHEKLIEDILDLAEAKGFNYADLVNESYNKYGEPVLGDLENVIEHTNIHGWLQERITSVEGRLAYIATEVINRDIADKKEIADVFYKNGQETMKKLGISQGSPEYFFTLIFDHMLEGMPCDRVSEVIESNDNLIKWETTTDLHKAFWDAVNGDVNNYHYFRTAWINGFLDASSVGYKYVRTEDGISTIEGVNHG